MAFITICPRCTSHLELPSGVNPAAQVQCPICEVEFSLATVAPRELPQARLLDFDAVIQHDDVAASQIHADMSPQARLARLLQSSTDLRTPAPVENELAAEVEPAEPVSAAYPVADSFDEAQEALTKQPPIGASRLDQLLSDLANTPPATAPPARDFKTPSEFGSFEPDFSTEYERDDLDEEDVVISPLDPEANDDHQPLDPRATPRRKRSAGGLRTLVGVVGGGALGLLLGAYGLLWLKGPAGDIAGLAQWLPPAMLPSSMRSMADANDDDAAAVASPKRSELTIVSEPPKFDAAVIPAAADEPTLAEPPSIVWPTSPIVGDLRDVKLYSAAELRDVVDAAETAHRQFLAGDLARRESWATMGPAYIELAALAERFTLTRPDESGDDLFSTQEAAKTIFRAIAADSARRADLATIAARWLQHDRRQNNGVLLAGSIRELRPNGKWAEYVIDVPLGETTVPAHVLMDGTSFAVGDQVMVVGEIFTRPQEQLPAYEGDAAQVIVAGYGGATP